MRKKREEGSSPLKLYKGLIQKLEGFSEYPEWEAREIIYYLTGKNLADFLVGGKKLSRGDYRKIEDIIAKRRRKVPLHYILGCASFMGIELEINSDVLIPRNETEILVEQVLMEKKGKILDIGTGSGAIAIVLAIGGFEVVATDISEKAIIIAHKNAEKYGVKIDFRKGAYFKPLKKGEKFDYIVSNPPYVSAEEYENLPEEVKKEPKNALVSPLGGMWHSYKIMLMARKYLRSGGALFMEISPRRVEKYVKAAYALGYTEVRVLKDLNGNFRVIKTRWE